MFFLFGKISLSFLRRWFPKPCRTLQDKKKCDTRRTKGKKKCGKKKWPDFFCLTRISQNCVRHTLFENQFFVIQKSLALNPLFEIERSCVCKVSMASDFMLRFLFYANFDNKVGPQLPICVPHPFITLKEFNEIAGYIIPRPSLSHRLISFHWKSNIILNYPIRIEDSKYERHAFFFSFGMVLKRIIHNENKEKDNNKRSNKNDNENKTENKNENENENDDETKIDIESYERILKRLTLIFLSLENDFLYLSSHNQCDHYPLHFKYLNKDNKSFNHDYLLRKVLNKIFEGFTNRGECTVNLLESRKIALKLYNKLSIPPNVYLHHVPVLICNLTNFIDNRWDISLQYVIKHINSVNHIKRIYDILKYKLIDVDYNSIKESIKQLLYYKYIIVTDIFKYNNLYVVTQNINNFINNQQMQQSLVSFIINKKSLSQIKETQIINQIYIMFTKFNGTLTVKQFMGKYKWKQHHILKYFDIHKFVLFGTVNKLIRRIHRYPIIINSKNRKVNNNNNNNEQDQETIKKLINLCDGSHCFDEIC
eukprot:315489_1